MDKTFSRAHIDITGRCNLRCIHCYAAKHYTHELSTSKIVSLIRHLKKLGIQRIALSGGEPLIHKGLFKIIAECPQDISILTNSHLLNTHFINKFLQYENEGKIFTFRISLDGLESYNKVRQASYQNVIKNIKKLLEKEFIVVVNTTLMPFQTKQEMIRLFKKLIKIGVDQWNLDLPFYEGSAKNNSIQADVENYADIVVEVAKYYKENRPKMLFDSVGLFTSSMLGNYTPHLFDLHEHPCSYQFKAFIVDAQGNIKICPSLDISFGNIKSYKNLSEYKKSKAWKNFMRIKVSKLKGCDKCKYREICGGGCRANVKNREGIMQKDVISCYLMERFEKDIISILPSKTALIYKRSIEKHSK